MNPVPQHKERVSRARSLPSRQPFDRAVLLSMIHYFAVIGTFTALIAYLVEPGELASRMFMAGVILSAVTWLVAYFKRRSTVCPLCKGTPLVNSGAHTHKKALRFYPLNHGVSATLSIIASQKFRCMYCGSDYDLLKPSSHLHRGGPGEAP